jgi:ribosomal protein S18 acetylase RimI-like enzyme
MEKKVGQLLIDEVLKIATCCLFILLGVWEENHRALKFYLKMVFLYLTNMFLSWAMTRTDLLMKLEIKKLTVYRTLKT